MFTDDDDALQNSFDRLHVRLQAEDAVTIEHVTALESATKAWLETRASHESADRYIAAKVERTRAKFQADGQTLVTEDSIAAYEQRLRAEFDRDSAELGLTLTRVHEAGLARIAAAVQQAEPLPAPVQMVAPASEKILLAGILDELQLSRVRSDVAGLTRAELVDMYNRSTDTDAAPFVRTVETAVLAGTLPRLGIRDDTTQPEQDVVAIGRLRKAVEARRAARVPPWLQAARTRVQAARSSNFTQALSHLQSGRGIASRPAAPMVAVR